MDMRFLESFVTVVDAGSIADAARRLDFAPTTIARQLRVDSNLLAQRFRG